MVIVTVDDKEDGVREERHNDATTWEVDGHDGLHVRQDSAQVASYAPTRWMRVKRDDS